jgi:hypothetical protein
MRPGEDQPYANRNQESNDAVKCKPIYTMINFYSATQDCVCSSIQKPLNPIIMPAPAAAAPAACHGYAVAAG